LVVASVSNNNASSFGDKPSSTFQLVVVSVDWISKGISNKPFKTLHLDRIKSKMSITFQLIVGSKQVHQKKPQQIKANANLQTTNDFQVGPPSQFNGGRLHELIVGPAWNPTFKEVQTANKSLTHIVECSKLTMNAFCPELIVECSYIALISNISPVTTSGWLSS